MKNGGDGVEGTDSMTVESGPEDVVGESIDLSWDGRDVVGLGDVGQRVSRRSKRKNFLFGLQ